ncbi:MAG TPA: LysR family transcriptional regulator, partial [Advenella sp.]|nr:LysR family transcriptional regulator [Advenella sp.]
MKTKVQASMPRFDLFTLQLVLAVKATGSIARAAESMHLTASAVSKRILELEDQLGTVILERHSQGARLNQA